MKKYFVLLLLFISLKGLAQNQITVTTTDVDNMLSNISTSTVNGNIIYNKCIQYADLTNFNTATKNTCSKSMFDQAINDLHFASGKQKFTLAKNINSLISTSLNVVDIGMLNASFSTINYDKDNPSNSGLTLSNNKYQQVAGKQSFNNFNKLLISALKEEALCSSNQIEFRVNQNLNFNNNNNVIKKVVADLGDGNNTLLIDNGNIVNSSTIINFTTSGNKLLKFIVTFYDNTTLTTYSSLYIKLDVITEGVDPLIEDGKLVSTIPYQGYDETSPIFGELDYRIFYHTNNGNTTPVLLKPIIISDGFDPQDKRKIQASDYLNPADFQQYNSIEHFMDYKDCSGNTSNLITVLRNKGYDVVVVNYPTYYRNGKKIDGGADYIERNAMNMITLIQKLNTTLQTNGSTEQLAIAAPSMGGQITRYALAYMEKMFAQTGLTKWKHKTRLWISIDSPHLGANIPYGLQSLIYLATLYGSSSADDFFYNQLRSPAAKQQLIEQFEPINTLGIDPTYRNGRTISQGFSFNSGSPFYKTYYDNQFNNGLPNSKGYPMNTRKISLVNGSLSGQTFGTSNQKVIDLVGFKTILFWDHKGFQGIAHAMADYPNTSGTMSDFMVDKVLSSFSGSISGITNSNNRGNMDLIAGGWFPGYDQFVTKTKKENDDKVSYWEERANAQIHSFIPAYSALGIKQPEQDWTQPLDRNLVCSNETPFDSYYGEAVNTRHTSFDCESVEWMLKELDGNPQAPIYPYFALVNGPSLICDFTSLNTYDVGTNDVCKFPSKPNWEVSNNLQIINATNTEVIVRATSGGNGFIKSIFPNGISYTKNIFVGLPPTPTITKVLQAGALNCRAFANEIPNVTYNWYAGLTLPSTPLPLVASGVGSDYVSSIACKQMIHFQAEAVNACGTSGISNVAKYRMACNTRNPSKLFYVGPCEYNFPGVHCTFVAAPDLPEEILTKFFKSVPPNLETISEIIVTNDRGEVVQEINNINTQITNFSLSNLPEGAYNVIVKGSTDYVEHHLLTITGTKSDKEIAEDIANNNLYAPGTISSEVLNVMRQQLFEQITYNPDIMKNSPTLQSFYFTKFNGSLGIIDEINKALDNLKVSEAQTLINSWTPTTTLEYNCYNYYNYFIRFLNGATFTNNDINAIYTLANKCPQTNGEIIHAARSLYNFIMSTNEEFEYACGGNAYARGAVKINKSPTAIAATNTSINIFPNPATNQFNIKFGNGTKGIYTVKLFNMFGKVVMDEKCIAGSSRNFNITQQIPKGIYTVQITNSTTGKTETQKLIIQ